MNADGLSHEMRERIQARVDAAASRARTVVSDAGLTERELDALAGAAAGETAEETAERLGIGEATVKSHRKVLLLRLGAVTMAHAIALVYRGGRGRRDRRPASRAGRSSSGRPAALSWSSLDPRIREVAERCLTPEQLEVVKLRATLDGDGEPLGWRKIGRQLDLDESTVRRTWERAERRLKQEFAALYGLDNGT